MAENKYNPLEDGITHINMYSKAMTELGRFLTNVAYCIVETYDGVFKSIEGYWGWLGISEENVKIRAQLKNASGAKARVIKKEALKNGDPGRFDENFDEKIRNAIFAKINSEKGNEILSKYRDLLHLPLVHYYYYGTPENCRVIDVTDKYPIFVESVRDAVKDWLDRH